MQEFSAKIKRLENSTTSEALQARSLWKVDMFLLHAFKYSGLCVAGQNVGIQDPMANT